MAWYELVNSRDGSVREYDAEIDAVRDVIVIVSEHGPRAIEEWELDVAGDATHVTCLARGSELAQRAMNRLGEQRRSA